MNAEVARYEKMQKDNNTAIKKLTERGKVIAAIIKALKALDTPEVVKEVDPVGWDEGDYPGQSKREYDEAHGGG